MCLERYSVSCPLCFILWPQGHIYLTLEEYNILFPPHRKVRVLVSTWGFRSFKSLAIIFYRIRWVRHIDSCSSVCLLLLNKSPLRSLGNSLGFQLAHASRSLFCSLFFHCATHYTSFPVCPSAPRTLPWLPDSTSLSQTWFPWADLFCTLLELTLYSGR